jgi:hypothetical protein
MFKVSHTKDNAASIRLARVASHLNQAGREFTAAFQAAPDRYHRNQLHNLTLDLRELTSSIATIVDSLKRGGRR